MKKLFTLIVGALVGAGAAGAAVVTPSHDLQSMHLELSQEGVQKLQKRSQEIQTAVISGKDLGGYKYVYEDNKGTFWNAQVLKQDMIMGDVVLPNPDTNEPFTLEEAPFYVVAYLLWRYDVDMAPVTQAIQYVLWPTYYYWDQIFNWDGPLVDLGNDRYDIPSDLKDLRIVDFEEFCNDANGQSRTFIMSGDLYPKIRQDNMGVEAWVTIPSLELDIQSMYERSIAYVGTGSTFTFGEYDAAERIMNVNNTLSVVNKNNQPLGTLRCNYSGVGRVEGFRPTTYAPEMGNIHILNRGVVSSETIDDNPYYESWEELQRYMVFGEGKYLELEFDNPGKPIDQNCSPSDGFRFYFASDEVRNAENTNYFYGYMYSAVGQEPEECQWILTPPVEKVEMAGGKPYYYLDWEPKAGQFHSAYYDDNWANDFGLVSFLEEYSSPMSVNTVFTVGSTQGSGLTGKDVYGNTVNMMTKTGKVFYHYDENNIDNKRELATVGSHEITGAGIAGIVAEAGINVKVAQGNIAVTAAQNADVTIYSLNGAVVKSANLNAGETLNVKAAKGLYIVKAGKKAVKVVL